MKERGQGHGQSRKGRLVREHGFKFIALFCFVFYSFSKLPPRSNGAGNRKRPRILSPGFFKA